MEERNVWRTYQRLDQCMKLGRRLGYPECCVNQFITLAGTKLWWVHTLPWFKSRNLKLEGYVPCEKCAKLPRQRGGEGMNSRRKVEKIK